jgi:hypothetical protein
MKLIFFSIILWSTFGKSSTFRPCGLEGSVAERIKSCDLLKGSFALVVRNDKGREIYKEQKSGLLWGDRISYDFNHYGSQKACDEEAPEKNLLSLKWRLPTVKEFEQAAIQGMKNHLPNMRHAFWTSTPGHAPKKKSRNSKGIPSSAVIWDALEEVTAAGTILDGASVRCVANE